MILVFVVLLEEWALHSLVCTFFVLAIDRLASVCPECICSVSVDLNYRIADSSDGYEVFD